MKGIIPRMMDALFANIINANQNIEFTVKCSFIEIYKEKINDLLDCIIFFNLSLCHII